MKGNRFRLTFEQLDARDLPSGGYAGTPYSYEEYNALMTGYGSGPPSNEVVPPATGDQSGYGYGSGSGYGLGSGYGSGSYSDSDYSSGSGPDYGSGSGSGPANGDGYIQIGDTVYTWAEYDALMNASSNPPATEPGTGNDSLTGENGNPPATPPEVPPKGVGEAPDKGTKIQDSGLYDLTNNAVIFVSDKTADGDAGILQQNARNVPVSQDVTSWDDLIQRLNELGANSKFTTIAISGHGSYGGVTTQQKDAMNVNSLTPAQAASIASHLKEGGKIVLLGCNCGDKFRQDGMQELAKLLNHPVVGNQSSVGGNKGTGDWYQFNP